MKADRITLKKGEYLEISFKQHQRTTKYYSTTIVAETIGDSSPLPEQTASESSGFKSVMSFHGPGTVGIIRRTKVAKSEKAPK
jgi:hypothetical protein